MPRRPETDRRPQSPPVAKHTRRHDRDTSRMQDSESSWTLHNTMGWTNLSTLAIHNQKTPRASFHYARQAIYKKIINLACPAKRSEAGEFLTS